MCRVRQGRIWILVLLLGILGCTGWSLPRGKVFFLNGKTGLAEVAKGQRIYLEYDARYGSGVAFRADVYRLNLDGTPQKRVRSFRFSAPRGRKILRGLALESGFYGVRGYAITPRGDAISFGEVSIMYDPPVARLMRWQHYQRMEEQDSGFEDIPASDERLSSDYDIYIVEPNYIAGDRVHVRLQKAGPAKEQHTMVTFQVDGRARIVQQSNGVAELQLDRAEVPYNIMLKATDAQGHVWSQMIDVPVKGVVTK